jgi:hypothetical protein
LAAKGPNALCGGAGGGTVKDQQAKAVVKVQLPVFSNESTPLALIYNEDRSIHGQLPLTRSLELLMKDDATGETRLRAYFEATVRDGSLVLGREVEEQDW